jgi:hypothetical protein
VITELEVPVSLGLVHDLRPALRLDTPEEIAAFEQDLLAEFVLARSSAGSPTPRSATTYRW